MRKVLLVDDDPLSVEFLRLSMEANGYSVGCACSCADARLFIDRHLPEVLVTDMELLDGSGTALAQYARKKSGHCIVGITGHSTDTLQERLCDTSVFDAILQKPIELSRLKETISRLVERR